MAAIHSERLLPLDVPSDVLLALARSVMEAHEHRFRLCLVLGPYEAIYLEPDGRHYTSRTPPSSGINLDIDPAKTDFLPS
jgi:hypothetical protein